MYRRIESEEVAHTCEHCFAVLREVTKGLGPQTWDSEFSLRELLRRQWISYRKLVWKCIQGNYASLGVGALCSCENDHYHAVERLKLSSSTLTPDGASPSFSSPRLQRQLSLGHPALQSPCFFTCQPRYHSFLALCPLFRPSIYLWV